MEPCKPALYLDSLKTPLVVFRPDREMEVESVATQAERLGEEGIPLHVVPGGVHGSSMLVPTRSGADIASVSEKVFAFLAEL